MGLESHANAVLNIVFVADDRRYLGQSPERERSANVVIAVDVVEDEFADLVDAQDLLQMLLTLLNDSYDLELQVVVS